MAKKEPLMIPFDDDGEMYTYGYSSAEWKDNFEFEDTLYVESMSRGRSSATFTLVSKTDGKAYNFFMKDMLELVKNAEINQGQITGVWTFCKRGQNYGVKLVRQDKEDKATDNYNELYDLVDKLFYDLCNEYRYEDELEPYLVELRRFMYNKEATNG